MLFKAIFSSGGLLGALVVLGATTAVSCRPASAHGSSVPPAERSPTVVESGGVRLTLADVDAPIALELFELRTDSANRQILSALVDAEAKRRGIGVDELYRREVDSKVKTPTEAELRELYEAQAASSKRPLPDFRDFRGELSAERLQAERLAIQQQFFDELLSRAKVHMDFDALGRPRTRTREGGPFMGPRAAAITIIEYTDFESPFCAQVQPTVERVLAEFPGDVRIVFRQNPRPEHPHASEAAEASLCADDQGRYWDYRKLLFSEQASLGRDRLLDMARRLGLDLDRFSGCLTSGQKTSIVRGDIEEARRSDMQGTPVFSVNGARLSGAHPFETFRRLITLEVPRR